MLGGKLPLAAAEGDTRKRSFIRINDTLDLQLQRLWEIEKLPYKSWTTEEILYEGHFEQLTVGNETGRYRSIVKLLRREVKTF